MKQSYENDVTMFGTVVRFLQDHTAQTSVVPAIATAVADLTTIISQIDAAATAQGTPTTGITADKEELRTALEEAVFAVCDPLTALAVVLGDQTLRAQVEARRSALDGLPGDELDAFAERVSVRATANAAALVAYGVTAGMITAIGTARTAFAGSVNHPRTAVAERSGKTAMIPVLVRSGKLLLRGRLDRLMSRYRLSDGSFYAAYRTARAIVDRRGGGGGTTSELPAKPVVTVDGIGTVTQTGHAVSARATSYRWLLKTTEDGDYTQIGEGPADFIEMNGLSNIFNFLKCIAINSAGESPESEPVQFAGGV